MSKFYGNTNEVLNCFDLKEKPYPWIIRDGSMLYQSQYGYIVFDQWIESYGIGIKLCFIHNGYKYTHIEALQRMQQYSMSYMITLSKRFAKDVIDGVFE